MKTKTITIRDSIKTIIYCATISFLFTGFAIMTKIFIYILFYDNLTTDNFVALSIWMGMSNFVIICGVILALVNGEIKNEST